MDPVLLPSPSIPGAVYERRWKTLGVLSLALLIIGLDADSSQLQWINDSYLLVFAALLLSLGTFGDRFGRKLALVAGTAIFVSRASPRSWSTRPSS